MATSALIAALAALHLAAAPPETAEHKSERMAVIVGNNHGLSDELELKYAESDAEKVAKVLVDLGGFSRDEVVVLTGRREKDLRAVFERVRQRPKPDGIENRSLLFFYYSGHGDEANLHMAGSRMPFSTLKELLQAAKAQVSITLMDSCKSGALTRAKGATLGPAYEIEFLKDPEVEGRIVITSSSEDEISQESDKIEGSFFTHHWVSGLYGAADANEDSLVTLEEAYRYAHYRTVEQTIESRGGVQHPSYNFSLTGQGNVVLANLANSTARIQLQTSPDPGDYFVLDADKKLILTELAHKPRSTVVLRLPPGEYVIRKREPRRILIATVAAKPGGLVRVADKDMEQVPYVERGAKGEESVSSLRSSGPAIGAGIRNGITDNMGIAWQIRASYPIHWSLMFLEPRFVFRRAPLGSLSHMEFDLGLVTGVATTAGPVALGIGLDLGLVLFEQTARGAPGSYVAPPSGAVSLGLAAGIEGKLQYPIGEDINLFVAADAGVVVFDQGPHRKVSFAGGGFAGLGYNFF